MPAKPSKRKRKIPHAPAASSPRLSSRRVESAKPAGPADSSTRAVRVLDWLLQKCPPQFRTKARDYLVLTRMDRPIGALLLLWPTWWALWLAANDFPPWKPLIIFTLGVFAMRAAGCAINDYADRKLDPQVARTAGRPLASGRVTPREALLVFAALLLLAFVLVLFTNRLTIELSFVGAALAALYPFTKRYTQMPQVVLGAAFGWSIPMAFAAVSNTVPPLGWLLFIANILWSVIYDTEYAMVDRDEDLAAGAKSTAILFGDADLPILGILMATFLLAMLFVGTRASLGWPYWLALAAAAGLFGWQQWLIRNRARDACLAAFRHNNWLGLTLWAGIVLALAAR
jgi:4-hydroxybenzoate polyprenyltransferase